MGGRLNRGELRWCEFRRPDKKRPVLVLTRDSILGYLSEVTVAPVTSSIRDILSEVVLGPIDGLKKECAVNLDHVQTVSKDKLGTLITTLSEKKMRDVRVALLFALGFD